MDFESGKRKSNNEKPKKQTIFEEFVELGKDENGLGHLKRNMGKITVEEARVLLPAVMEIKPINNETATLWSAVKLRLDQKIKQDEIRKENENKAADERAREAEEKMTSLEKMIKPVEKDWVKDELRKQGGV